MNKPWGMRFAGMRPVGKGFWKLMKMQSWLLKDGDWCFLDLHGSLTCLGPSILAPEENGPLLHHVLWLSSCSANQLVHWPSSSILITFFTMAFSVHPDFWDAFLADLFCFLLTLQLKFSSHASSGDLGWLSPLVQQMWHEHQSVFIKVALAFVTTFPQMSGLTQESFISFSYNNPVRKDVSSWLPSNHSGIQDDGNSLKHVGSRMPIFTQSTG